MSRVTLEPEREEAIVIAEIFELFAAAKRTPKAIAEHPNRPAARLRVTSTRRETCGHWAASTVRAMLRNPVYTGRLIFLKKRCPEATSRALSRDPEPPLAPARGVCGVPHQTPR